VKWIAGCERHGLNRISARRILKLCQSNVLALSLALGVAIPATAESPNEKDGELLQSLQVLKKTRAELSIQEQEKRRILGALYAINQRMKKISDEKGALTNELIEAQDAVKSVAQAIAQIEASLEKQRSYLRRRLRAMYMLSQEGAQGVLFAQRQAFEFDAVLRNLRIVADADHRAIQNYQKNLQQLAKSRTRLKSQVARLLKIEKRIESQEKLLAAEHLAKSKLAEDLDRAAAERRQQVVNLRKRGEKIQAAALESAEVDLTELLRKSLFERKGQLSAPIQHGELLRGFGLWVDPQFKFRLSHKGWLIESDRTQEVRSLEAGVVAFQGNLGGIGPTIVVDHGDNYYSVYSGLQQTSVRSQDRVSEGTSLGRVAAASELYFEIRHFAEPENPMSWISHRHPLLAKLTGPRSDSSLSVDRRPQTEDIKRGPTSASADLVQAQKQGTATW
jgi:septal ring factor EnvC (AmiA/AmiB activator)